MAKKQCRTQDLIGLNRFGENGIITDAGDETVWFLVQASNLSVLSPEHIGEKIANLTGLLSVLPECEILCVDAQESFDANYEIALCHSRKPFPILPGSCGATGLLRCVVHLIGRVCPDRPPGARRLPLPLRQCKVSLTGASPRLSGKAVRRCGSRLGVRRKVPTRKQSQNGNYKRRDFIRFLIKFHLTYCILHENRL